MKKLNKSISNKLKNNKIFYDLLNLKLIKRKNLEVFSSRTRDMRIAVLKDTISNVIFLSSINHSYKVYKKEIAQFEKQSKKNNISVDKIGKKRVKFISPNDDLRRYSYIKNKIKNKSVLDFGCGIGTFLSLAKKVASEFNGYEVNIPLIKKLNNRFKLFTSLDSINKSYDFITMFHVLEHLPDPIIVLKKIRNNLKKNGKIIIEIPHSKDLLFNLDEFKKFSLWSEHLVLHTEKSIKKILIVSGYKNIKVEYIQRYNFLNHFRWFLEQKPQGHTIYKKYNDQSLINSYEKFLKKNKLTDTLLVTASK